MTTFQQHVAVTAALAASLLGGCRVGPAYSKPPAMAQAPPPAYKEAPNQQPSQQPSQQPVQQPGQTSDSSSGAPLGQDAWKVAQPGDAMLHGKWWEIYNDAELNTLEDRLNIDNQNIKQFFENFMEARTLIAQARSQLFPTVSVGLSGQRSGSSANLGGAGGAGNNTSSSSFSLPADVSWEPDLWGKVRNEVREAQYSAQVSAADLENERLTEQASLAEYIFEIHGQDALAAVFAKTLADDRKALDYTRAQYETGVGTEISVVEAENTLENAQAAATNLGVARAQFEHAIAVLVGTDPSSFSVPVRPLDAAPPAIPIGMPSQLLERRPDIAASERTMAAANANIGVADAAYFPAVTLSADAGFESSALQHLFNWPSRFWSLGGSASETVFDAGLRRATVNQYVDAYNADVAGYRQTVLTAFQQVEDYLAAVRILSQQIGQQQMAAQSAQRFVDLETARYETGIDPYVDVVTAQNTLLADQQTLTTLHTQAMTASVQLIEALGGGWDSTQLPTPAEVSKKLTPGETSVQR